MQRKKTVITICSSTPGDLYLQRNKKNTVINKNHPYLALERNLYTKIVLLIKIHRKGKLPTHNTYTQKIDPFPNKPWFLCVCSTSLLKTLLEKEKLLVTSNFSFSHSVFCPFGELSAILIKFLSANFQFGMSKICCLGKGYDINLAHLHNLLGYLICNFSPCDSHFQNLTVRRQQTSLGGKNFKKLPLQANKLWDVSKLKAFADEIFIVAQMVDFFLDKVENILGKGENTGYQHFLFFP